MMKRLLYLMILAVTLAILLPNGHTEPVVTDGFVSYWTFDEKGIADVRGENDEKIIGAPKIVGGQVGEAKEYLC